MTGRLESIWNDDLSWGSGDMHEPQEVTPVTPELPRDLQIELGLMDAPVIKSEGWD